VIVCQPGALGGGDACVFARGAGSFPIQTASGADTSTIAWMIM
jgi:hypothetical protein